MYTTVAGESPGELTMFGIETLTGIEQSVAHVGIVLGEALTLYVGYGALTRLAGPSIERRLKRE